MAFPWKTLGKYALQIAEYALAQKLAPAGPVAVPIAPANGVPLTNPPIEAPQPKPVDTDAVMIARVRVLYKDILNRSRSDITGAEMDEAIDLLRVGREDELVRNLNGRK